MGFFFNMELCIKTEAAKNPGDLEISYDEGSLAAGSEFPLGRTSVTYSIRAAGEVIAKCDFIITVKDFDAPRIDCPGDVYLMPDYNSHVAIAKWREPFVSDNVDDEVKVVKVEGRQ